jgi:hypothetical protein
MSGQQEMPGLIYHRPGRDGSDLLVVNNLMGPGRMVIPESYDGDRQGLAQAVLDVERTALKLWPPDGKPR